VQITASGDTTSADIVAIDWLSGDSLTLASVTFPRPQGDEEEPIRQAQFADDGGLVRLYWMADATLRLWVLGAPAQQIHPIDGTVTELEGRDPQLWSPDGERQIQLIEDGTTTTLHLVDGEGRELAMTSFDGLVSHLRWAPDSSQVVFTGGGSTASGVVQDLYLWNLNAGDEPARLTATGAGFGAEWLGAAQFWAP
jgi:WD40 repeat protein